jgi:multiple sugar transport system substrate-binding protein
MKGDLPMSKTNVTAFILFFILTFTTLSPYAQDDENTLRLLLVGDPFGFAIEASQSELETQLGMPIDVEIVSYNDMRRKTLINAQDLVSGYDIVSFDVVWLGEYYAQSVLLPLNDLLADTIIDVDDFLPSAYTASAYADNQYGVPIQPHPELLWYRQDLFDEADLAPPITTDDVLRLAAYFNQPDDDFYGICWNAQRGQALGQTMAHFYAAFGQPLLDATTNMPTLDTPRARAAAQYALDLLAYSPPDILNMAWDQRITRFSQEGCAMTYGWGARAFIVETLPTSRIQGKTGYTAAPYAPDIAPATPLGVWSLGIPANIGERTDIATQGLALLTEPATLRLLAQAGNGGMPRLSLLQDDDLQSTYPTFAPVLQLSQDGAIATWMRPSIPQWTELANIMGSVFHDMLRGNYTPAEATAEAQAQALALFEANR